MAVTMSKGKSRLIDRCSSFGRHAAEAGDLVQDVGLQEIHKHWESTQTLLQLRLSLEDTSMKVIMLPKSTDALWPSMLDVDKQRGAIANKIICVRQTDIDRDRIARTINNLRKGQCVAWLGRPGIGKSSESNVVMFEFIRKLGIEDWPTHLLHRVRGRIFEYSKEGGEVVCKEASSAVDTLTELARYLDNHEDNLTNTQLPVLFLELADGEQNPQVRGFPTFVAVSSREVEATLQTMKKSQTPFTSFIVRPHTPEEVDLIVRVLHAVEGDTLNERLALPRDASAESAVTAVRRRTEVTGPVLRVLLKCEEEYRTDVVVMEKNACQLFSKLSELTIDVVPSVAKLYVSPYPVSDPSTWYTFRFLSNHAAALIAAQASTPEKVKQLHIHGLDYQVIEAMLRFYFSEQGSLLYSLPDWARDQPEWHTDPGFRKRLSNATLMDKAAPRPTFVPCTAVVRFKGQVLNVNASELREGTLYSSSSPNYMGGEFAVLGREPAPTAVLTGGPDVAHSPRGPPPPRAVSTARGGEGYNRPTTAPRPGSPSLLTDNDADGVTSKPTTDNSTVVSPPDKLADGPQSAHEGAVAERGFAAGPYITTAPAQCGGLVDAGGITIILPQSTTLALPDHPLSVSALRKIFTGFHLYDAENAAVTVTLLYFTDWSNEHTAGVKFEDTVEDKKVALDLAELRVKHPAIGNRVRTYILRCGFYATDRFSFGTPQRYGEHVAAEEKPKTKAEIIQELAAKGVQAKQSAKKDSLQRLLDGLKLNNVDG